MHGLMSRRTLITILHLSNSFYVSVLRVLGFIVNYFHQMYLVLRSITGIPLQIEMWKYLPEVYVGMHSYLALILHFVLNFAF
jgi:hypothetical protein